MIRTGYTFGVSRLLFFGRKMQKKIVEKTCKKLKKQFTNCIEHDIMYWCEKLADIQGLDTPTDS